MRTENFDFPLPSELIAQHPAPRREDSRMLVVHRAEGRLESTHFRQLAEFLHAGDLLVLNDSRVFPARLRGQKEAGGGRIEALLLEPSAEGGWWAMVRPGKRLRAGTSILFPGTAGHLMGVVRAKNEDGHCRIEFPLDADLYDFAERHGEIPLPPYIARKAQEFADRERYQTVYARQSGSVAAPTAGLHFSTESLAALRSQGVETCTVTLHVGVGTFAPVKVDSLEEHRMHSERFVISPPTAEALRRARAERRRVIAVGTTSLRVIETAARQHGGEVVAGEGRSELFLYPPADFLVTDGLLTNFHLPRSTLVMLVSAFANPGGVAGRELVLRAYARAVEERYRFFSYGDAMLLL